MILVETEILHLEYFPKHDLVVATYPDIYMCPFGQVEENIGLLIQAVQEKNVTKILLDASRTNQFASADEVMQIVATFANALLKTNVTRVARIQTESFILDATVRQCFSTLKETRELPFQIESFNNRQEALIWLNALDLTLLT